MEHIVTRPITRLAALNDFRERLRAFTDHPVDTVNLSEQTDLTHAMFRHLRQSIAKEQWPIAGSHLSWTNGHKVQDLLDQLKLEK